MDNLNPLKKQALLSTADRIKQYREQQEKVAALLATKPDLPYQQREADKAHVLRNVQVLSSCFDEFFPYLQQLRSYIKDVTDQNKIVAAYLLFGKVSQGLLATFGLAANGFHYEVMEIVRSSQEAIDLAFYFLENEDANPDLIKWFEGKIVGNEAARKQYQKYADTADGDEEKSYKKIPFNDVKAGIYGVLSGYTHVSYASLLDSFDVFNRDFDFERIAGYHYVASSSLPYMKLLVESTIIGLKHFYAKMGNRKAYMELDAILKRLSPDINDKENIDQLTDKVMKTMGK